MIGILCFLYQTERALEANYQASQAYTPPTPHKNGDTTPRKAPYQYLKSEGTFVGISVGLSVGISIGIYKITQHICFFLLTVCVFWYILIIIYLIIS